MKKIIFFLVVIVCVFASVLLMTIGSQKIVQAAEKAQVELFTWQWVEPQNKPYFEAFRDAFNEKYPDINLKVTGAASGEFNQKLLTRISAGDAPDVFAIRPTQVAQLAELGALEKLDAWINTAPWKDKLLAATKPGIIDGSYYAIIFTSTPQALVYNKKIFEEVGVEPPKTTDELFEVAQKIYEKTGIFGFGVVSDATNNFHMNVESRKWVCGFGGDWAVNNYPSANSPETIEGIKMYKKLYDAEFSPKGKDLPSLDQLVWEGKLAMMIEGAWLFGAVKVKNPERYPDISAALPPTPTNATIVGGAFFGMSSGSKYKDAAWKVLDLYNSQEWQQKYVSTTAQIPAQGGMITEEALAKDPWWAVFDEGAEKYAAGYGYMAPGFEKVADEYNNEIGIALADILQGDADVEKRLNKLQDMLESKFVK